MTKVGSSPFTPPPKGLTRSGEEGERDPWGLCGGQEMTGEDRRTGKKTYIKKKQVKLSTKRK